MTKRGVIFITVSNKHSYFINKSFIHCTFLVHLYYRVILFDLFCKHVILLCWTENCTTLRCYNVVCKQSYISSPVQLFRLFFNVSHCFKGKMNTPAWPVFARVPNQVSLKLHVWPLYGFQNELKCQSWLNAHYIYY